MSWLLRLRAPRAERTRAPLWVAPSLGAVVAFAVAIALARLRPDPDAMVTRLVWPGSTDSAVAVLETIAASVITVTSLTFTLTVVALQLASQQFSPRLLRESRATP